MTRSNLLAFISFAVVFAAGVFIGHLGWGGSGHRSTSGAGGPGGSLTEQLDLTADQREKVRKIWDNQLQKTTTETVVRWESVEKQRDAEMRKLLTKDQLPAYEEIVRRHLQQAAEFSADLRQLQRDAENQTRQLLTPAQRDKFEKLIQDRAVRASGLGRPVADVGPAATRPKVESAVS